MISTVTEQRSWLIVITRGTTDWPRIEYDYSRPGHPVMFKPEQIRVALDAGKPGFTGSITGFKIRADGTPGRQPARNTYFRRDQLPEWAQQLIDAVRSEAALDDATVMAPSQWARK